MGQIGKRLAASGRREHYDVAVGMENSSESGLLHCVELLDAELGESVGDVHIYNNV